MAKRKTNPNGANQYLLDPRQAEFFKHYLDPKSSTFSNALQSALAAGFSPSYAESLMTLMPDWLSEKLGELSMLSKAERNHDQILDLKTAEFVEPEYDEDEEEPTPAYSRENPQLLKIKADVSKFVAERLGRKKYGQRDDQKGGDTFNTINIFSDERAARIARRVLNGDSPGEAVSS